MKKYSLGALVAAGLLVGGLSAGSASAADLGGNCCADLEERIAELEATTARKGNRKVSLTISGWVAEQVMWWDDGVESNVYVGGIGTTLSSHFKMTGQATIAPGWSAGYVLHVEQNTTGTLLGVNQDDDEGGGSSIDLLQSFWFIKSDNLGKVSVGKQSQASDNTAILVDGSGSLVPANWVVFEGAGFFLNAGGARVLAGGIESKWADILECRSIGAGIGGDCNGATNDVVRYDSPTFGGFSVSASWGEDDMWDVAARYAGEFGGFKLAAAAAYNEHTDSGAVIRDKEAKYFQAGLYIEHVATGVFVYGAYGNEEDDGTTVSGNAIPDADTWYVKGGLRERWTPLGHTVLYGEYMNKEDGLSDLFIDNGAASSEFELWGIGAVQEIDAAAMSLWVSYRHFEGDVSGPGVVGGSLDFDDFDMVKAGALINF